ncbi:MAG: hypothetical protein QM644_07505 [Mobilitalea sp.]
MKLVYRVLLFLHVFVGVGAMGGGLMAILNPEGPGGMPTDALKYSPFNDFLIPGIILFVLIGLGNVFCSLLMIFKIKYQAYISCIISAALVIWIIVQCIILRAVVSLHIIFFIIGLVEGVLSLLLLFQQRLFPTNIIINIIERLETKYPKNNMFKTAGNLFRSMN